MPGFNGRGPAGAGPMTGGGRGYCNSTAASFQSPAFGSRHGSREYGGRGGGRSKGRGFCRGFRGTIDDGQTHMARPGEMEEIDHSADELRTLKTQVAEMAATLEKLNRRLGDSEKASEK